jgi:hypothetical protein
MELTRVVRYGISRRMSTPVEKALEIALRYGGIDGDNHKAWVIDQMVRALCGKAYKQWVKEACDGEDGPNTYTWDEGTAP